MTAMRSAFWTVASLCAMISVVRSAHQYLERKLHHALALGVEGAGRLVEQQHGAIREYGACNRYALALSA